MTKHFIRLLLLLGFAGICFGATLATFNDSVASNNHFAAADDYFVHPEYFVKINEIYSRSLVDSKEQIELFNPTPVEVALTNCSLFDGTNHLIQISGFTIPANGFLILRLPNTILNNSGDELRYVCDGDLKDRVAWGDWDDGNLADNAPNPDKDGVIGRYPDGKDTDIDSNDFVKLSPSLGSTNHL